MSFLPENYQAPKGSGNYMKFLKGANKFRVLTDAIVGWEYWVDEDGRKPVRVRDFEELSPTYKAESKHFWAFGVYNYNEDKVQILELTQKSIMNAMEVLSKDEDWGDPKGYDIVVTRTGDGLETLYQTNPKPHSELTVEVPEINLDALFDGDDPFAGTDTKTITESRTEPVKPKTKYIETLEGKSLSKTYYAYAKDAGYDSTQAHDIAVKLCKLDSYTEINKEQLAGLIERMKKERAKKPIEEIEEADLDEILNQDLDSVLGN